MGVSGWYQGRYGKGHVIIYIYIHTHMKPNPRITLFPYSNIQEKLTIIFYGTNDKDWNSDLYWKVMFNSCDKYGVDIIYFVVILMNKHKLFIYF